jgi:hypothetical protein
LQSGATSLFYVQRSTFDVRRSSFKSGVLGSRVPFTSPDCIWDAYFEKNGGFDVFIHSKGAHMKSKGLIIFRKSAFLFFAVLPVRRYFWWINGKE